MIKKQIFVVTPWMGLIEQAGIKYMYYFIWKLLRHDMPFNLYDYFEIKLYFVDDKKICFHFIFFYFLGGTPVGASLYRGTGPLMRVSWP